MLADLVEELDREVRENHPGFFLSGVFLFTEGMGTITHAFFYQGEVKSSGHHNDSQQRQITAELIGIAREKAGDAYKVIDSGGSAVYITAQGKTTEQFREEKEATERLGPTNLTKVETTIYHNPQTSVVHSPVG